MWTQYHNTGIHMTKTEIVKVRVTKAEQAAWKEAAKRLGLTLSEFLRRAANNGGVDESDR